MKKLKESSLRVGDIILTTSPEKISKIIRKGTRSDISHAMIYVQSHSVIDATGDGVHSRNTQRLHYKDDLPIHVYRMRRGLTEVEALSICNFARAAVGTEYTVGEALQSVRRRRKPPTRKQFCSRLAARAYAQAGIALVEDPNYCTPDELKHSPDLIEVQDVTEAITQAEIDALKALPDGTLRMQEATNALLNAARKRRAKIQDINDIDAHLMKHPGDDDYMCRALLDSGYLTLWKLELDKHPYRYDLDIMNTVPDKAGVEKYCRMTLADEPGGSNRYLVNRGGYIAYSTRYPLRYFKLKLELHEFLAALHAKRVNIAREWLVNNKLLAPTPMPVLGPHSPEWFAALEVWNPKQAAITKFYIEKTGSVEVCSTCGDDPAQDYRLPTTHRAPGGVDTLRLCSDCLGIRHGMGEPYEPLTNLLPGASGEADRA